MTGWRPASKRPRNGQRVVFLNRAAPFPGIDVGTYSNSEDVDLGFFSIPWSYVRSWIPESELIKQARAAGKSGAK